MKTISKIIIALHVIFICAMSALAQENSKDTSGFPVLTGPYLGQRPPGMTPEIFALGIVSKIEYFEHSSVYFTPDMNEVCWLADSGSTAKNRKLFFMKLENGKWNPPKSADFCEHYSNSNLSFSPDGRYLFFWRVTDGSDIYWVSAKIIEELKLKEFK